jgi:hypothetical protein
MIFILICCTTTSKNVNIGQENAIWVESVFLRGYHPSDHTRLTDENLIKLAATLENNNIRYAYLFAGPFSREGFLPDYSFSDTAVQSVKTLKELYPGIVILPWVGGIQNKTVFLNDSLWVKNALSDSKRLINTLNVPGLHFDFEFILKGNDFLDRTEVVGGSGDIDAYGENVNEFHRYFRELMPEAFVSSVVVSTSPGTKHWKRKTTIKELTTLTRYVDQLSFLYYDTYLSSQRQFEENCKYLLKDIRELKKFEPNVQYLISIGTFINALELQKYRNMEIENIPNSLKTIRSCQREVSSSEGIVEVDGISIFCNWETDDSEWREIYKYWTGIK